MRWAARTVIFGITMCAKQTTEQRPYVVCDSPSQAVLISPLNGIRLFVVDTVI